MPAAVAVGAYGRDLPVVLEEGERYLPSLSGLLIHGGMMAQACRAQQPPKKRPRRRQRLVVATFPDHFGDRMRRKPGEPDVDQFTASFISDARQRDRRRPHCYRPAGG